MNTTLNHTVVQTDKLTLHKYKEHLLMKYEGQPLLIQTPWLNINAFGMPRRDKYHTTDDQLKYIKLPLDTNVEDIKQFHDLLQTIDNKVNNADFRKEHLGEKHNKYAYNTVLTEKENKPVSVKFKFMTTRDEIQDISTQLYKTKNKQRTQIRNPTIDDFIKHIPFRSTVRCIFQIVKVWSQPATLKNPTYGLTLKLHKIEVNDKPKYNIECVFIDDDDDDDKLSIDAQHYHISSDDEERLMVITSNN